MTAQENHREVAETACAGLKSAAASLNTKAAMQKPEWERDEAPGCEWMESARLGPYLLMSLKTLEALHDEGGSGARA